MVVEIVAGLGYIVVVVEVDYIAVVAEAVDVVVVVIVVGVVVVVVGCTILVVENPNTILVVEHRDTILVEPSQLDLGNSLVVVAEVDRILVVDLAVVDSDSGDLSRLVPIRDKHFLLYQQLHTVGKKLHWQHFP